MKVEGSAATAAESIPSASEPGSAQGDAPPQSPPRNDLATAEEREIRAGITMFLGTAKGFTGLMKDRYSDFVVNEITKDGTVVHLTNMDVPSDGKDDESGSSTEEAAGPSLRDQLVEVLGEEQADRVLQFVRETPEAEQKKAKLVLPKEEDKDKRTKIHQALKLIAADPSLPGIYSQSDNGCVLVYFEKNKKSNNFRNAWPKNRPQYLEFVLYKENKETTHCVNEIGKMVRVKPNMFTYAGTKDKRGLTTQLFRVQHQTAERMKQVSDGLYGMHLGNFRYVDEPLSLGQLQGNRFTVVLRNVEADDEAIATSITELEKYGFLNYFGMQRFGTGPVSTDRVGLAILKNDWKRAVELCLRPGRNTAQALEYYMSTKDAKGAFEQIRRVRGATTETLLLKALMKCGPSAYQNAMYGLPRNLRILYTHGYQSKVWNLMVSKRIEMFGRDAVVGDFVEDKDAPARAGKGQIPVRALSEEDIASGKYGLKDVVMPLPGHLIKYPEHLSEAYSKLLEDDGLDISDLKRANRDFSLTGEYRHIVVQPSDIEWGIVRYDSNEAPLTWSEIARLRGEP